LDTERDFPFFLLGHDRSGTTMLRLVLDRGEASVPPESMFLVDFAPVRRAGRLDDRGRAERFLREVWNHPRVRLWHLSADPPALPAGLSHEQAYRFAVTAPFVAYAQREGKTRWGDKTPLYLRHVDELAAVWPEARFLVLVRDGRDVALSVLPLPFGPNNVWAAARSWAQAVRLGRQAEQSYPGRVLTLRYEDVVERPAEAAERACAFLELRFEPDMLAVERTDSSKIVEDQSAWFTNVWAGINASAVGKWRTKMSPREQRIFESVAGQELKGLGYEIRGAGRPAGLAAPVYAAHDTAARVLNFVRLRLLQERGREVRYVVMRKLARSWR
jgi:Sulfotransferase family